MLKKLKEEVYRANVALIREGLVKLTWGNASGIDREQGLMVIKPSGIAYEQMKPEQMVVLNMEGEVVEGTMSPSSDSPTHLAIYQAFNDVGGVVHTHSEWATSWAQACREIPCLGTTHADHFYGPVPCTRLLRPEEIQGQYEKETGKVIVETFTLLDAQEVPAVLVAEHGPFCWGKKPAEAVKHAVILEEVAKMAFRTVMLGKQEPVQTALMDKHYKRKNGPGAYYGQNPKKR